MSGQRNLQCPQRLREATTQRGNHQFLLKSTEVVAVNTTMVAGRRRLSPCKLVRSHLYGDDSQHRFQVNVREDRVFIKPSDGRLHPIRIRVISHRFTIRGLFGTIVDMQGCAGADSLCRILLLLPAMTNNGLCN